MFTQKLLKISTQVIQIGFIKYHIGLNKLHSWILPHSLIMQMNLLQRIQTFLKLPFDGKNNYKIKIDS